MNRVSRRSFSSLLACLLVGVPAAGLAQVPARVRSIGFLEIGPDSTEDQIWQALAERGWVEGRNLHIERRYATSIEALPPLAEELVRAKVEVIVAGGPNQARAVMRATTTIPIVFRRASDPILFGLVKNLARPEGNVTGFYSNTADLTGRDLSLLKELLPNLKRVGILETSGNPSYPLLRSKTNEMCRFLAIEPIYVAVSSSAELDRAMAGLVRQGGEALVIGSDRFMVMHASEIVAAALAHGLPTMGDARNFIDAGGLAAHAIHNTEPNLRTASYVDRILRGAKPADLPVEQPTAVWLGINVRTAQRLGIRIPESVIVRADFVAR